jgi:hypothetical protein
MPDPRWPSPEVRRRIARVVATWGALTLGSVVVLAALIIWHLIRRGRLIQQGLGPPRVVRLPEIERPQPPTKTGDFTAEDAKIAERKTEREI